MKRKPTIILSGLFVATVLIFNTSFVKGVPDVIPQITLFTSMEVKKDTLKKETKRDVVVTRIFDAPLELAWKAWSDATYVMQWWGPKGFTCPLAKMDFQEGGTSLVCMRAPKEFGGKDMYNTWTYRKIVPMERIEFIMNFTDQTGKKFSPSAMGLPPGIPDDVRHVITFKTVSDHKTEVTVTEYGYTSDQVHDLSKTGLEECLDKMATSLQAVKK